MDLRNSNGFELSNFYFLSATFTLQPYRSFFKTVSSEVEKMHHVELNSGPSII